jgi:TPR repeat protein
MWVGGQLKITIKQILALPILSLFLLIANPVASADYQRGVDAALQRDFVTTLREWNPLAEQGGATSQFQLGWLYYEGNGVTQNYETALKWYRLAAEQGYAYAQSALGRMYADGHGVSQDYTRAYMWFSIAASLWDPDAGKQRDLVTNKLTAAQLKAAHRLVHECVQKNFKGC